MAIWTMRLPGVFATDYRHGYSSSHALVVGVDQYHFWPHLEYAVQDAGEVAALLRTKGFQVHMLTNQKATMDNILHELEAIKKSVDLNSRVLFFFAGHGQTEDLPGGGERGYILPVNADPYNWQDTMLAMNRLNNIIRQIKAKHIFLAFDSCYSGLGLTRSIKRQPDQDSAYISKMMLSRSIQILTAGSRSEQAIEADGHGLFTKHLLAALSGTADINSDGYITATEIYATLRPSVTQRSYSRQTPQFGYIEGNGDIIFYSKLQRTEPSTVEINTRISGISVWADTARIGYRLPAGRHQLVANAGPRTIMVKRGSQTLYRKKVVLQANQAFLIELGVTATIPRRRPLTMLTIANRKVKNYSNSIAYDLDGNGREEIVTASGNRLYALKPDGSIFWEKTFRFPIMLDLIDVWNRQPAIGLSATHKDQLYLFLLNGRGEIIWQNDKTCTPRHPTNSADSGNMAQVADIDRDGYKEIIALHKAVNGKKPNGIIVYDQNGKMLWRQGVGPVPQDIVIWEKDGGRPDIIMGTFSAGHGNHRLHNATRSRQAYIISIDGYGQTNWARPMGSYYTGVQVLLADFGPDGQPTLYAYKYTAYKYRDDEGGIYKISRSGKILEQFETGNSILSVVADGSVGDANGYLYAIDKQSTLFKLDDRLNLVQEKSLNENAISREMRLVGIHDYDGDGVREILMYSFHRFLFDKNPLSDSVTQNKMFYSNLRFQILSQDFSKVIKSESLAEKWEKRHGFVVKNIPRPEMPCYPFMALSDKVIVYNY
jgi:uncharacterized caspase-like protein